MSTLVKLRVKKVTVFLTGGTDKVSLTLDAPTPYPEMGYEASADISTRRGYGAEWCKAVLGIEPEVIDITPSLLKP